MGWVDLISCLLPEPPAVRLETWGAEPAPPTITLTLTSRCRAAPCPLCGRRARRTHSWYERALADLPWSEHAVAVQLHVWKLFCDNAGCKRRISTERLPSVLAPWACKTARLSERLTAVGLALGGAAGARLGRSIGLATSRNTCCAWSGEHPCRRPTRRRRWAWMTGRCASGTSTSRDRGQRLCRGRPQRGA